MSIKALGKNDYNNVEIELKKLLSKYSVYRISHIGSTAISDIWAKNIIDELIEITTSENMESVTKKAREKYGNRY